MEIFVCIGSSCHLKGSYDIINEFKRLIEEKGLEEKITLNASFCLGHCIDGVTIKVDEEIITGLNRDNAAQIFEEKVMPKL